MPIQDAPRPSECPNCAKVKIKLAEVGLTLGELASALHHEEMFRRMQVHDQGARGAVIITGCGGHQDKL